MDGGSTMESGDTFLGYNETDHGELRLTGSGTTWTTTYTNVIGSAGSGEVSVTDGAHLVGSIDFIGGSETGVGTVLVKGTGSQWSAGTIIVGNHGTGTLNVTDGGKVVTTGSFTVQHVDPLDPASSTGTGTLNLGVSQNAVLVQAGGTFTNNGTVNVFALGNLAGGDYNPVSAGALAGEGTVNSWGGTVAEGTGVFMVSAYMEYTDAIVGQDLSGARVNAGDGALVVAFADNAGTGNLELTEVETPLPSGYSYYEAVQIDMRSTAKSSSPSNSARVWTRIISTPGSWSAKIGRRSISTIRSRPTSRIILT
jgi:fibronectin-binding autotransporter adhesin